jgi:twinkle protein
MMLQVAPGLSLRTVLVHTDAEAAALRKLGVRSVRVIKTAQDVFRFNTDANEFQVDQEYADLTEIVLALPAGCEQLRDDLAVRLGDVRCKWVKWPDGCGGVEEALDVLHGTEVVSLVDHAHPMWTDEVCTIDDVPDPLEEQTYKSGLPLLDRHGFRFVRPAFMPVIGPYGSGKSVLLRQLSVNLWRLHGWRTLITSFEEKIKPRYQRDLRRHMIGKPVERWCDEDVARADAEIRQAFRFLRRKRNTTLDADRFLDRLAYAVEVYGVDVVMLDPVNELDHCVPKGESKTDYMGRFIMRCKQLADDYNLLFIAAAHPPKDGVEKRLQKNGLLTLNDGADTAHYGNKADIGWAVWRNLDGPTLLHVDKIKDHESMGKPTVVELMLDPSLNKFRETRLGYDILTDGADL